MIATQTKILRRRRHHNRSVSENFKPALIFMLIPLVLGGIMVLFVVTGLYGKTLAQAGNQRLITKNWAAALTSFEKHAPAYERKFAYYRLEEGQTLASVAEFFSVKEETLAELNPGSIVPGTTIKVPPLEHALEPVSGPNGLISQAIVTEEDGILHVRQLYKNPQVTTTIPDLANYLKRYNALEQTGPLTWRLNKPISIEDNIRLDVTGETVKRLELRSTNLEVTCLCFDHATTLIKDTDITSYDPTTGKVDNNSADGRSFVRDKNGRLDVVNSRLTYLGNGLDIKTDVDNSKQKIVPLQKDGGMYGASWRISNDKWGQELATGWIEGSTFSHNHFGAYTFGASGMTWRNNRFSTNEVYGLDPHDDTNNMLVENNVFDHNGKHGFIASKRCDYNIIRGNTSYGNKLHGFMLHDDSSYNLLEHNIAYDNTDNFVIYHSDYNTVKDNTSYNAHSNHVRVNENSRNNYITGNKLFGGYRGIYIYGKSVNLQISGNNINVAKEVLATDGASNALFANNIIDQLSYKVPNTDRLIFGPNTLNDDEVDIPAAPPLPAGYTSK